MQTEFEAKILEIDVEKIISELNLLGAIKIGEKLQKRFVYSFAPVRENSWVRLRTDGEKTTMTIKEIHSDDINGTKELEISVDSFEKTNLFLEKLGYVASGYQENRRISYLLDDVEIEIDFWPQIPPYMEIEAKSVAKVEMMIEKLGFEKSQATSINTIEVYRKYGIDLQSIKELKF
ncbi:CYTH domain-containing protein [Candidatus Parcubacteria bacterium]|nr:CYTH domain-containing protein [Candidatus Parcubacteria bacterium]